ncbi:ATP-dependent DNA ligase [Streptomyces violaceoruber]
MNGELVVWESGRLAFERLQQRLARRRGAGALAAARACPAHLVVFGLMRQGSTDLPPWPCSRRRTALEELFAETRMTAPLTLCPSTADPDTACQWLNWTSTGQEGLVFTPLRAPYRAGARARGKYKICITEDRRRRSRHRPRHRCGGAGQSGVRLVYRSRSAVS